MCSVEEIRKKFPYFFAVIILLIIIFIYISFQILLVLHIHPWTDVPTFIFTAIYNIIFFLLMWSIIQAMRKDPGKVPFQWGFHLENQARKYCLICHVFKPERTHHCSSCGKCVLNMDHHCPWINSCIGFHNRKPFILMLAYTILSTLLNIIAYACSVSTIWEILTNKSSSQIFQLVVITIACILNIVIFFTIFNFLKFHLELIFSNMTTLQSLELKRQGKNIENIQSQYDLGKYYNWVQTFGRNSCTWFIPIFLSNEGPVGDGVIWPKKPSLST